jgi:hypothetical protein
MIDASLIQVRCSYSPYPPDPTSSVRAQQLAQATLLYIEDNVTKLCCERYDLLTHANVCCSSRSRVRFVVLYTYVVVGWGVVRKVLKGSSGGMSLACTKRTSS